MIVERVIAERVIAERVIAERVIVERVIVEIVDRQRAVVDGTLTRRSWDQPGQRSGNAWWLTEGDGSGAYCFYAHLADLAPGLAVGSRVEAGEIIGFMGNTGASAFPHLHSEIHPNGGGAVNPYPVLRQSVGCKTGEQYRQSGGWVPD